MSRYRRSLIETLDVRRLLSVTAIGDTLEIVGTDGPDRVSIQLHPNFFNLMLIRVNGHASAQLLGGYSTIKLNTLGGADTITINDLSIGHPDRLLIDAGAGNDRVYGSPNVEQIAGGSGNDRIAGGGGAGDYIGGGNGNDYLVGGDDRDSIVGGAGNDTIDAGKNDDTVYGGDGDDQIDGNLGNDSLFGQRGNDRIVDVAGYNVIYAGDGDDDVRLVDGALTATGHAYGEAGNDRIVANNEVHIGGGEGDDRIIGAFVDGEAGNDRIVSCAAVFDYVLEGGDGDDVIESTSAKLISGGNGNDTLRATGRSTVRGDDGDDHLSAPGYLDGGLGHDTLIGSSGNDSLVGGPKNDLIFAGAGADTVHGKDGDDTLHGEAGRDSITGGKGNDVLYGGRDDDKLEGNDGDDRFFGGDGDKDKSRDDDGNDIALGGEGLDWFERKHDWASTDETPAEYSSATISMSSSMSGVSGLTISNGRVSVGDWNGMSGGSLITNVSLGTAVVPSGGLTTLPTTPIVDGTNSSFKDLFGKAAVLVGTDTYHKAVPAKPPTLSPTERKSIKGSFIHLPPEWSATKLDQDTSGLAWYRIATGSTAGASLSRTMKITLNVGDTLTTAAGNVLSNFGTAPQTLTMADQPATLHLIGVHKASVMLFDAKPNRTSAGTVLQAAQGLNTNVMITRAGTQGLLAGTGQRFSFATPRDSIGSGFTASANFRAMYTNEGVIYFESAGPRMEWFDTKVPA